MVSKLRKLRGVVCMCVCKCVGCGVLWRGWGNGGHDLLMAVAVKLV